MRRRTGLIIGGGGLVAVVIVAALVGSIMSVLGAGLPCSEGGTGMLGAPPTRAALREIPKARLPLYREAGKRFNLDWTFLASIGMQECSVGTCPQINSAGCGGPMGIALVRDSECSPGPGPTIWERFGVDADGNGLRYDDLADAIFTAAHILKAVMGAPGIGGSYGAYREAACHYYGACASPGVAYASQVMARAIRYGFRGEGTPASTVTPVVAEGSQGSSCEATSGSGETAIAAAIVAIAQRQLGRTENPIGSNCTVYGPCEEWCSLFVSWVWERAGVEMKGGTAPYAYSGSIYEWALANEGKVLPATARPAPGDAVLFGSGPRDSAHVAIVERVFGDGEITTIDGNYADRVSRVGPFSPLDAVAGGEPAAVYAFAQPPAPRGGGPVE